MHFTPAVAAAILAFCATNVLARPTPQLGGEATAAYQVINNVDNGSGYGIENAEDNLASDISAAKASVPATRRQLGGEATAAYQVINNVDNGSGYGTENAEDNLASDISAVTGNSATSSGSGSSSGNPPPPPPPKKANRRQLDKIAAGAQELSNAAGTGSSTTKQTGALEAIDGELTSNVGNAGTAIGSLEDETGSDAGDLVPASQKSKRQLDKVAAGAQELSNAAGTGSSTSKQTSALEAIDGELTGNVGNAGTAVGSLEDDTGSDAGNLVPASQRRRRQITTIGYNDPAAAQALASEVQKNGGDFVSAVEATGTDTVKDVESGVKRRQITTIGYNDPAAAQALVSEVQKNGGDFASAVEATVTDTAADAESGL